MKREHSVVKSALNLFTVSVNHVPPCPLQNPFELITNILTSRPETSQWKLAMNLLHNSVNRATICYLLELEMDINDSYANFSRQRTVD
jgi:hypothetical protein